MGKSLYKLARLIINMQHANVNNCVHYLQLPRGLIFAVEGCKLYPLRSVVSYFVFMMPIKTCPKCGTAVNDRKLEKQSNRRAFDDVIKRREQVKNHVALS